MHNEPVFGTIHLAYKGERRSDFSLDVQIDSYLRLFKVMAGPQSNRVDVYLLEADGDVFVVDTRNLLYVRFGMMENADHVALSREEKVEWLRSHTAHCLDTTDRTSHFQKTERLELEN